MRPSKACGSRKTLETPVLGPRHVQTQPNFASECAPFQPKMQSSPTRQQDVISSSPCAVSNRCAALSLSSRIRGWVANLTRCFGCPWSSRNVCALFTLSNHHSLNHCLTILSPLQAFHLSCPESPSLDSFCYYRCCPRLSSTSHR